MKSGLGWIAHAERPLDLGEQFPGRHAHRPHDAIWHVDGPSTTDSLLAFRLTELRKRVHHRGGVP